MRCFHVLVHAKLEWTAEPSADDASQPPGFFCNRYVLASNEQRAAEIAFERVRRNLDRQTGWFSGGAATALFEAEEISLAPFRKLLAPINRGHVFYDAD